MKLLFGITLSDVLSSDRVQNADDFVEAVQMINGTATTSFLITSIMLVSLPLSFMVSPHGGCKHPQL
jgi:hypothetical protein